MLEREDSLTAHSTGRSAAQYIETYGGPVNQALTVASRDFLAGGAEGWADTELLQPRARSCGSAPPDISATWSGSGRRCCRSRRTWR